MPVSGMEGVGFARKRNPVPGYLQRLLKRAK